MRDVVIVAAARSPIGKKNGALSAAHPTELLGQVMMEVLKRAGVAPALVGQVVGGCINKVGAQAGFGKPITRNYREHFEFTSQFEGAERIATKYGITREDTDRFGLESQVRAARAIAEGRFDAQLVPVEAPV